MWEIEGNQRILLASIHHSMTDAWSVAVLQNELSSAYAATKAGGTPAWAPLPVQVSSSTSLAQLCQVVGFECPSPAITLKSRLPLSHHTWRLSV